MYDFIKNFPIYKELLNDLLILLKNTQEKCPIKRQNDLGTKKLKNYRSKVLCLVKINRKRIFTKLYFVISMNVVMGLSFKE